MFCVVVLGLCLLSFDLLLFLLVGEREGDEGGVERGRRWRVEGKGGWRVVV